MYGTTLTINFYEPRLRERRRTMTAPSFDELKTIDRDVDNNVEIALDHAGRTVVKITLPDYSTVEIRASHVLATMAPLQYERALDRWRDDRARDTARQCSQHGGYVDYCTDNNLTPEPMFDTKTGGN